MSNVFSYHEGSTPLLVSVPHDGWQIPMDIVQHMSEAGRAIADTDWHVSELYEFVKETGASLISANFSRYVVDLNRPADDTQLYENQGTPGLCPEQTFAGADIYLEPIEIDKDERVAMYWQPYHDRIAESLSQLHEKHGYALLWDAHSIPSTVPSLFDGELPVLNIGTYDGRSCAQALSDAVMSAAEASEHDAVLNGRFKGGHITRRYGDPESGVHALQLELAQRAYMDERTLEYDRAKAVELRATLKAMLDAFQEAVTR
ncbi:MAG: N-formylglutamate deformylase [Woeseiaceae bacterium]